jgi:hypothetical protein
MTSSEGRQVTVRYARPGDVLGIAVLVGGSANVDVQALAPSSLFRISARMMIARRATTCGSRGPWRRNYAIEKTRKASPGPVGAGTIYRQTRSVPSRSEEGFEVTVFEPGKRLAVRGQIGPFRASMANSRTVSLGICVIRAAHGLTCKAGCP